PPPSRRVGQPGRSLRVLTRFVLGEDPSRVLDGVPDVRRGLVVDEDDVLDRKARARWIGHQRSFMAGIMLGGTVQSWICTRRGPGAIATLSMTQVGRSLSTGRM